MHQKSEILRFSSPSELYRQLSIKYKINISRLKFLARKLDLGKSNLERERPLPGSIRSIADQVGLPPSIVWALQEMGGIHKPILPSDLAFLRLFKQCFKGSKNFERGQSRDHRFAIKFPWEKYVLQCYMNSRFEYTFDGRMVNPEERIYIRKLAKKIAQKFGLKDDPVLWEKIKKIREIAQNKKRKQ